MKIKTILNKLFFLGKMFFFIAVLSFLCSAAEAEYFLVYDAPLAVCAMGCGSIYKVKKYKVKKYKAKKKCYKSRYIAKAPRRSGYRISVYYPRAVPACACPSPCVSQCNTCCVNKSRVYTRYYDVYYRQPAYYRDYSDGYDDGYYAAYNNDMRTGDDRAVGMDIDY